MVTSGTEEFGWRGYLAEKMLQERNFWDAGWSIGWVWAAWHYPVVAIMFIQAGMIPVQIIGSLAGFTMGIVAMSIFHAWFYQRTSSVFLNIVIHSLFNTLPFTIVLLYEGSPAALLSNLLLWAIVFYLRKREGISD
jgi:membrane protease YdiL (CAAX protease family)